MNYKSVLDKLPVLEESKPIEITIEDINEEHASLTIDNPLTWMIYIARNSNLTDYQIEYCRKIIKRLTSNQKVVSNVYYNKLADTSETVKYIDNEEKKYITCNNIDK